VECDVHLLKSNIVVDWSEKLYNLSSGKIDFSHCDKLQSSNEMHDINVICICVDNSANINMGAIACVFCKAIGDLDVLEA
jgi:hypothetical protein